MSYERDEDLVVLPRRVIHQPEPFINDGGDCGACVLGGLLGLTVPEVYEKLQRDEKTPKPRSFEHYSMISAVKRAHYEQKLVDRWVDDMPAWQARESMRAWGDPSWMQSGAWWNYLSLALLAGFYAITQVDVHKKGPLGGGTNHWIMLCGARVHWKDRSGQYEVLVSCSSRSTPDEEWVEAGPFLRERGGFWLLLVRPS